MVKLAEKYFDHLPTDKGIKLTLEDTEYLGGNSRIECELPSKIYDEDNTHILLGLKGSSWNDKNFYSTSVLNALMGGGSSFSSGGPGKGMYSRLYTDALTRYGFLRHFKHFLYSYDNTGVLGIHGICPSDYVINLVQTLCEFLRSYENFSANKAEVDRAKAFLKSMISMNLECRISRCEDLGRQVYIIYFIQTLVYGRPYEVEDICESIDNVTVSDVIDAAKTAYESPTSFAVLGSTSKLPPYEDIDQYFRS